jgi:hypothetical protein
MSDMQDIAEKPSINRRSTTQKPETSSSDLVSPLPEAPARHDVHCLMQAKGGVGKSFAASMLVQWHQVNNRLVAAFDTDPMNQTLCAFPGLAATPVRLLDHDQVDVDAMDGLIEEIVASSGACVIDNGAASFHPMLRYLLSNDIAGLLGQYHRRLVLHTVVVGGQTALDTLSGMVALLQQFPATVPVVVWVNEYAGTFDAEGHAFEETRAYQDNAKRIAAVVHLHPLDPRTHGRDAATMLARQMTFEEAIVSPDFKIVAKSRLSQIRTATFEQLDATLEAI